jgi:hypothetical protein
MRYVLTLVVGLLVGGALVYFLFVGAPSARQVPGEIVRAPEPGGPPPGTAVVELNEQFFNELLGTIFSELGQPAFRLGSAQRPFDGGASDEGEAFLVRAQEGGCQNQIVILPEASGVQTGVRLENGQVLAPLAFTGSYNASVFGCQNLRGTAQANIQLRFDPQTQNLYGQLNVDTVNLEGLSPLLAGPITAFVQNVLNQRVNPLTLMRGDQITVAIPVQATGGTLRAQATGVNSEIVDRKLRLYVTYDFSGARGAAPAPPQG